MMMRWIRWTTHSRDNRRVYLLKFAIFASCTVEVEGDVVSLCGRLPSQDHIAIGICLGFERKQGNVDHDGGGWL